jgi:hypothetical protein
MERIYKELWLQQIIIHQKLLQMDIPSMPQDRATQLKQTVIDSKSQMLFLNICEGFRIAWEKNRAEQASAKAIAIRNNKKVRPNSAKTKNSTLSP